MREILFRGKLLSTGEWVEGNLAVSKTGVVIITPDNTPVGKYGQVDPGTVGQYIGYVDKNGKKVFEGDVIEMAGALGRLERLIIGYEGSSFIASTPRDYRDNIGDVIDDSDYGIDVSWYAVIGNIYDKPELLN